MNRRSLIALGVATALARFFPMPLLAPLMDEPEPSESVIYYTPRSLYVDAPIVAHALSDLGFSELPSELWNLGPMQTALRECRRRQRP